MPEDEDETCDYWHNCEDGKDESQAVCHWWCVLDHRGHTCTAILVSAGSFVMLVILRVLLCKVRPSKKRGKWMEKRKSSDDATVNDKFEIVALWIRSFCYYICCCCCKLRVPSREKGKLLEVREIPDDPADDKFEAARRFASKNWLEIVGLWFKFCLYYIFCCCVGRSKKPSLPQDNPYTVLNESVYSVTAPEPCDMARSGQDIKPENPEVKETAKDESDLANRLLQYVENV
nr:hypothetical protein BaRGS_011134 [Batillaria attramentaria]